MQHIIIAPHPDDEIIGCWEILEGRDESESVTVLFDERPTEEQKEHLYREWHILIPNGSPSVGSIEGAMRTRGTNAHLPTRWYFPDPNYEYHPKHRYWGSVGAGILQRGEVYEGQEIIFYSTNMNAPYIREVNPANVYNKRQALDLVYPSKASLWQYDHKYFLFEGRCQWL